MELPGVDIQIQNGGLGQLVQSDDALAGLVLQGPAPTGLALLTPQLITSVQAAEDLGIDAAYDSTNSVAVYKHIKEFYDQAGTGAKLWIIITSQTVLMATLTDLSEADYVVKLLNAAEGKIRLLGVTRSPDGAYVADVAANHIDIDVVNAITNAHALAEDYADNYKPLRVVLEGRSYDGDVGSLLDLKTLDKNRVAVMLGDTFSGEGAMVGVLLGRLASDPVMRNPGRVKSGALAPTAIYLGTESFDDAEDDVTSIHAKGYVTIRRFVGKAGFYFSDDPTATAATDDYNSIARGRVIDKALFIAYSTFVDEILDEVEIDSQGRIATAQAKYFQSLIDNAINQAMTANSEISDLDVQIDADQNVLSTNQICIELRITPVGYAKQIVVKLGFQNPANS